LGSHFAPKDKTPDYAEERTAENSRPRPRMTKDSEPCGRGKSSEGQDKPEDQTYPTISDGSSRLGFFYFKKLMLH